MGRGGKDGDTRNSTASKDDSDSKKRVGGFDLLQMSEIQLKKKKKSNLELEDGPCMMPILPIPNFQHWNSISISNASSSSSSSSSLIVMNGTAKRGRIGPSVGAVDIGVSTSAYFFRVALPGVKKDPGQFSCEIERDGKVHVRGVTSTGGRTVTRNSRVFEMKFQQQCPPGPFNLSFSLPGPVDPRLFSPYFRSDGILEAVVLKYNE